MKKEKRLFPSNISVKKLFPTDLPAMKWVQFDTEGFDKPVCGIIHRMKNPAVGGVPLGGIDTGFIDLETSGLFGYCTIFNSHVPRRGPMNLPFLGLSVGGHTWVLCDPEQTKPFEVMIWEGVGFGAFPHHLHMEPGKAHPIPMTPIPKLMLKGVSTAKEIHYWGHYPVADLEYETDAPFSVGLRAWSPFLPGDVERSMLPGAVFEVHLRNITDAKQKGTLAFSFPGPTESEAGSTLFRHVNIRGAFNGVAVLAEKASYALGVAGDEQLRTGGELSTGNWSSDWSSIAEKLPDAHTQSGASLAVDFELGPQETRTVRFVLAWHSAEWKSGGYPSAKEGNIFTHMYAKYYLSEQHAAFALATEHESLLKRILAWQQTIYTEENLPVWLREALVNNFHLITEVGMWAQARPPIGDWCRPEDGIWAQNESPRGCPQLECGGNSYYGGMAVLYFFPELTLSTLRAYKAYMYPDGCPTWIFGGCTAGTPPCEMTMPTRGYQVGQNGSWLVAMVARYWMLTGDDDILREFYPSLKKTTGFTFTANPERPYGLISLPTYDQQESFESTPFKGMTSHVGIIRLYHLKMMECMAERVNDKEFSAQCRNWYKQSSQLLEEHLWTGSYYRQHNDLSTGDFSDVVMAYQLDGEFMAWFDGLREGVLPSDRVQMTLHTLKKAAVVPWGARVWSSPAGGEPDFNTGYWTANGVHAPSALMLAMTYMYQRDRETGLDLAQRVMENMILRNGWSWDMPILYRGDTGEGIYGNDYAQMMMIWALPAAVLGQDLKAYSGPGGLVERIIQAGK